MAFHIPQELMNNNPLAEDVVRKRFAEKGFQIIDYTYKNNQTRMTCFDQDGYKVKVSLGSLSKNVKQYKRFSLSCNLENFIYNANVYRKRYNIPSKVIDVKPSKIQHHISVLCVCKCGNHFWCDFNLWRTLQKVQCNTCTKRQSNLEYLTQQYLDSLGVKYIAEYRFEDCRDVYALPFDFYLPDYRLCIEVDGEGHYSARFHETHTNDKAIQQKMLQKTQLHDAIKNKYCADNNITLLRLKHTMYRSNGKPSDKFKKEIDKQLTLG